MAKKTPKKKEPTRWADHVGVRSRYRRSVHLERDSAEPSWLEGYVVTPLVRRILRRVLEGLSTTSAARAWSLTGPYGSGKSAFALFLTNLLTVPGEGSREVATQLLRDSDPKLWELYTKQTDLVGTRGGLCPVLATGDRAPLDSIVLRALRDAAVAHWPRNKPSVVEDLQQACATVEAGETVPARKVVGLAEALAAKVKASTTPGTGLLIVIDEAGKPLEFAAHHSGRGDIHLLQELAEAANRSGTTPIVVVTLLHQAFERYAGRLGVAQRNEWAKVQGRFEDVGFRESVDQVLRLIGAALGRHSWPKDFKPTAELLTAPAASHVTVGGSDSVTKIEDLLDRCLPLHPVTAMVLGPLFRSSLAQNERSLFAFLGATEPGAFAEFLNAPRTESADCWPTYAPDHLYDYVKEAWGSKLYGHEGRRWAQIEEALRRLPEEAEPIDARIVKIVGLLNIVGESSGLLTSENVILWAVGATTVSSKKSAQRAIRRLQNASLLVYRKFRQSYQLWEGSDLDLDALVRNAYQKADLQATLVQRVSRVAPPRPLVARRHLFTTGTLRYFSVRYTDETLLDGEDLVASVGEEDGILWIVLPTSEHAAEQARRLLEQPGTWLRNDQHLHPVVVGLPRDSVRVREVAFELGALEYVMAHTPELSNDLVAKRELDGRIRDAESILRAQVLGILSAEEPCQWHAGAAPRSFAYGRELSSFLSELCDDRYPSAPHVNNELLNRRHLSSPAAGARRNLLEAMLQNGSLNRLGIEGHPPEFSMYRSVLQQHGLHREEAGAWQFGEPKPGERGSFAPAWACIAKNLRGSEKARVSVEAIYEALQRPPFGMKQGLIPVLLIAYIATLADELALYEDARFIPRIDGPVIERMLRNPKRFELQRFAMTALRKDVFKGIAKAVSSSTAPNQRSLVPLVRLLVRTVAQLSDYARRTSHVGPTAVAVREALLRAQEPPTLMFRDLPLACGCEPLDETQDREIQRVQEFVERLKTALTQLVRADANLEARLAACIDRAFQVGQQGDGLMRQLAVRAATVLDMVVDPDVRSLCMRLMAADQAFGPWITSIATLVTGKPPHAWHDVDADRFEAQITALSRKFATFEALAFEAPTGGSENANRMVRISVTEPGVRERAHIAVLREEDEEIVTRVQREFRGFVASRRSDLDASQLLAAIAVVCGEIAEEMTQREPAAVLSESK